MSLRFTLEDARGAADAWGCNCGPAALAAVTGRTLDEIRPLMGDFEKKRYTNPTLMFESLTRTGAKFWWRDERTTPTREFMPRYGLLRVQWHGPWMKPGVPVRARYRHTHWIGVQTTPGIYLEPSIFSGIFDVNAMNARGWIAYGDWASTLVPWLLEQCEPKADGKWSFTHAVEIERPQEPQP